MSYHSITTQPQFYNYLLTLYGIYSTVKPFDPPTQNTIILNMHLATLVNFLIRMSGHRYIVSMVGLWMTNDRSMDDDKLI